ncbi:hypothetical protein NDU88_005763 [Pleurodeles waltl]|uniref:Uncharacterized protein n=1 Tax=Pleurodeles waltl TaxID=8319 RepID=A0AAV7TC83_PLEWA|nr:hypothetical protein NDU88_005763 [Pleurodeles waltl]
MFFSRPEALICGFLSRCVEYTPRGPWDAGPHPPDFLVAGSCPCCSSRARRRLSVVFCPAAWDTLQGGRVMQDHIPHTSSRQEVATAALLTPGDTFLWFSVPLRGIHSEGAGGRRTTFPRLPHGRKPPLLLFSCPEALFCSFLSRCMGYTPKGLGAGGMQDHIPQTSLWQETAPLLFSRPEALFCDFMSCCAGYTPRGPGYAGPHPQTYSRQEAATATLLAPEGAFLWFSVPLRGLCPANTR